MRFSNNIYEEFSLARFLHAFHSTLYRVHNASQISARFHTIALFRSKWKSERLKKSNHNNRRREFTKTVILLGLAGYKLIITNEAVIYISVHICKYIKHEGQRAFSIYKKIRKFFFGNFRSGRTRSIWHNQFVHRLLSVAYSDLLWKVTTAKMLM